MTQSNLQRVCLVPEGESIMVAVGVGVGVGVEVGSGDRSWKLGDHITTAPRKQRGRTGGGVRVNSQFIYMVDYIDRILYIEPHPFISGMKSTWSKTEFSKPTSSDVFSLGRLYLLKVPYLLRWCHQVLKCMSLWEIFLIQSKIYAPKKNRKLFCFEIILDLRKVAKYRFYTSSPIVIT